MFLIYDWEFYAHELYTPDDFKTGKPNSFMEYVSIGERTSMTDKAAFGKGTYRLNIILPDDEREYALLLPEIFSSYDLYINNKLKLKMGDNDKKNVEIQDRMVTFDAAGSTQIILSVSNYSHFYSGMVYPPTFGSQWAINTMRGIKLMLLLAIFLCAFICFVISIYMELILKQPRLIVFTLLSIIVAFYSGISILHYFFAASSELIYSIKLLSGCLVYTFTIALHNRICKVHKIADRVMLSVSVFVCILAVALGLFSADISIGIRELISNVLGAYKWLCGIYLIVSAIMYARDMLPLVFGTVFFGMSLVFDRLYPVYEPIYGGYFVEISYLVLMLCLAFIQWNSVADAIVFKLTFDEEQRQMCKQIDIHKNHYRELSSNIENIRQAYHDMRHHLRVMQNYIKSKNYTALSDYINSFEENMYISPTVSYCKNLTIDALLNYYAGLCKLNSICFDVKFDVPETILFPDTDITILLGNLLENALEACQRQQDSNKFINVRGKCSKDNLLISITNSYDGRVKRINEDFVSRKRHGGGMGIKSVNSIVDKYSGIIDFEINETFSVYVNIVKDNVAY